MRSLTLQLITFSLRGVTTTLEEITTLPHEINIVLIYDRNKQTCIEI